ncbi:hypothetical protein [Oceanobacillus rekensis]|uniref:hypothetical protein n=1 Tax=Oceanobacillus rekensis TaxID=937927 RepID=UPI000B44A720|nr:hypothetical protein [Oceanobacillus rekensis]
MSLSKIHLGTLVKRQYLYKCKANITIFNSMLVIQAIAILFSLSGTGQMGFGGVGYSSVDIQYYSADIVIVFTMIWGFISSIQITTKDYKEYDYAFVTNRLSSNLSNIAFSFTASVVGALTAIFSGYLIKVMMIFFFDYQFLGAGSVQGFGMFISGLIATMLFIFMVSSLGYLIGSIVQFNKIFIGILPALLIGSLYLIGRNESEILLEIGQFYFDESSILIVIIKTGITAAICFLCAVMISNRQEVRK